MSTARARLVVEDGRSSVWFWCPGCETHHSCWVQGPTSNHPEWSFNGNIERPTLHPSVLVQINRSGHPHHQPDAQSSVCHSFVTDGRIQYLGDCTHKLAGQTVDLPPIAESMGES